MHLLQKPYYIHLPHYRHFCIVTIFRYTDFLIYTFIPLWLGNGYLVQIQGCIVNSTRSAISISAAGNGELASRFSWNPYEHWNITSSDIAVKYNLRMLSGCLSLKCEAKALLTIRPFPILWWCLFIHSDGSACMCVRHTVAVHHCYPPMCT